MQLLLTTNITGREGWVPERGPYYQTLLPSDTQVEIPHLTHQLYQVLQQCSNAKHRTVPLMLLAVKLAKRMNQLGFDVLILHKGHLVGGQDRRFQTTKWVLLEEYKEPPRLTKEMQLYLLLKKEVDSMTDEQAELELLEIRRRRAKALQEVKL